VFHPCISKSDAAESPYHDVKSKNPAGKIILSAGFLLFTAWFSENTAHKNILYAVFWKNTAVI
jgi:hypothetical protein